MLTSVNQIGFDFYDWVGGVVSADPDVLWFVGARRDAQGRIIADPSARFAFPAAGERRAGTFRWTASDVDLWFTFGPVPLRRFDLRGTFVDDVVRPDSQFLAEAVCEDIPEYGALIPATGMCDPAGVITAGGTFLGGAAQSPALRRVPGLQVEGISRQGATVAAAIEAPAGYTADEHSVSILLLDDEGLPVPLDYFSATKVQEDGGRITGVTVTADEPLPEVVEAVVMTDAFPAARRVLEGGAP
jgi:hypothetical protein